MDINGKVVIMTGASAGIGLAAARLFTQRGAKVALAARSADKLSALSAELKDSFVVPTDMRDETAIRQMVETVHQHYGRVDILVNNAGQGMGMPIEQIDLNMYREIMQLNVFGVLVAMQAVIPIMRQQGGGLIMNISSAVSKMAIPNLSAYASTKYALNALSLTARTELAKDNIKVSIVYPGRTATDFGRNSITAQQGYGADRPPGSYVPQPGAPAVGMPDADSAEQVAETMLEATRTEEAEVFVDSVKRMMQR